MWRHVDDDDGRLEMVMSPLREDTESGQRDPMRVHRRRDIRLARKWYNNDNDVARKPSRYRYFRTGTFIADVGRSLTAEAAVVARALVFWPSGYFDMKRKE